MKIFILGSYGPSLLNFRGDMIKSMIENGHQVIACAPDDDGDVENKIRNLGAEYIPLHMTRTGMNPLKDFKLYKDLKKIISKEKPEVFLSYTIKPNIYGTLAAYHSGVENVYGMMTGAGSVIRSNSFKMKAIQMFLIPLYKHAFSKCKKILFLNEDDLDLFKKKKIITTEIVKVIGSSGVNIDNFIKEPVTNKDTFLFIARLIKDKGIYEFINAAEIAKRERPKMMFKILGPFDTNPTAIKPDELEKNTERNIIEYLGSTEDVRPFIRDSFTVTLPSYHEGQGRVLVEAMAMGRAVLATNVPGCRQTIVNNITGYLVPAKNADALAKKMIYMYDHPEKTLELAENGYNRAHEFFDVKKINNTILKEMDLIS